MWNARSCACQQQCSAAASSGLRQSRQKTAAGKCLHVIMHMWQYMYIETKVRMKHKVGMWQADPVSRPLLAGNGHVHAAAAATAE